MWRSAPSSPSCPPSSDRFLLGHINTAERGSEAAAEPEKSDVRTNNTVSVGKRLSRHCCGGKACNSAEDNQFINIYWKIINQLLQFSFYF